MRRRSNDLKSFLRQWSIAQCAHLFDRLTRQLFKVDHKRTNSFHNFHRLLKCWLTDDCYDVEVFENLLKKTFENDRRVFDTSQLNSKTKIAVFATTISNAFLFVFSNYNEVGIRHSDNDKFMFKQL